MHPTIENTGDVLLLDLGDGQRRCNPTMVAAADLARSLAPTAHPIVARLRGNLDAPAIAALRAGETPTFG